MRAAHRGHVLALTLACIAAVGALIVAGAQWRLTQSRAAATRWHVQAAEVLAQSAIERGLADLIAGRTPTTDPLDLPPGTATVTQPNANTVRGCGTVDGQTVCLDATVQGMRVLRVTPATP